jgi:hypothetical protein
MPKLSRTLALVVALFVSACSTSGSIDWVEKLDPELGSDRKSAIKGLLEELTAFEEQVDLMTQIMQKSTPEGEDVPPSLSQVQSLLGLDQGLPSEDYNPAYQEDLEAISVAFTAFKEAEQAYREAKGSSAESSMRDARDKAEEALKQTYRDKAATIIPFLTAKLAINRVRYIDVLVTTYETGEPCRHSEIVDALRSIGSTLRSLDAQAFRQSEQYSKITAVFVKAIESDISVPPLDAISAVKTLGAWEAMEQLDMLVKQLDREKLDFALGDAIIRVIVQFATPENADQLRGKLSAPLQKILMVEPTLQPISYIGMSAKGLANLGVQSPEIIDRLIECLWLDDARGRNAAADCRLALNMFDRDKVGQAAHRAFKRQVKKIEDRANQLSYAHTGLIEAKSSEIIGDVQYADAVSHLVMSLSYDDVNPEPFAADPAKATFFTKGQVQKTISIARALAMIGDTKGVKPLVAILQNEEKLFEYKMAAAQQLAYLGSDSQLKALIKIFNKKLEQLDVGNRDLKVQYGKTIALLLRRGDRNFKGFQRDVQKSLKETQEWVKQTEDQIAQAEAKKKEADDQVEKDKAEAKALREKGVKVPSEPRKEKVDKSVKEKEGKEAYAKKREEAQKKHEEAMKAYLEGLSEDQKKLRELEAKIEAGQKASTRLKNLIFEVKRGLAIYQTWEKGYQEILAQLDAVSSLRETSQWVSKLADEKLEIRTIAAYVLARKSTDRAIASKAFIERLAAEKDPLVRDVILFGLARHASASQKGELKAIRAKLDEEVKARSSDPTLKGTIYSLDLLIASLR